MIEPLFAHTKLNRGMERCDDEADPRRAPNGA